MDQAGRRVFTVGHLRPRDDVEPGPAGWGPAWGSAPNGAAGPDGGGGGPGGEGFATDERRASTSASQTLRVRRSTYVPTPAPANWAHPPRVLIVEDDAVCRKMSTRFLEVAGCTIDVALDGVSAVNKMNLERYDLVLMVSPVSSVSPVIRGKRHRQS